MELEKKIQGQGIIKEIFQLKFQTVKEKRLDLYPIVRLDELPEILEVLP